MQLLYKTKTYRTRMIIFIMLCAITTNIILPVSVSASELQSNTEETIATKGEIVNIEDALTSEVVSEIPLDIPPQTEELDRLPEIEESQEIELEALPEALPEPQIDDITPIEVKTLTIVGPGSVGASHRIRSYGTSENGVLYQFWVKDLSANKWIMIQDYSKNSAPWTPTKAGKYLYGVHIKDEKSNAKLDAHLYQEITIKDTPVEVKTLTLDGSGNVGASHRIRSYGASANGVLYQFWVKDLSANKWTMIQDYSKNSAPWTPTRAGKYLYGVHIKDEKSNAKLDAHLYQEITIKDTPVEVKTLTLDGSGNVGASHRIRSYGASANGVLYQFWVKDLSANKWTMIQDYSKSSAPWTPTKAGKYLYGVHIKDEKSSAKLDTHLYKEITIKPTEVKTLTLDGSGYIGGSHRIRSYGTSANGVLYQFWVKDLSTNKWTMIQDYSKSSAPWTPTKAGKYLYGVHIKDEKSSARLDTHLYKEITIKPTELKTLTIDGSSYVGGSHRIRSYGESANGVLYQFWVKDLSTNKWTMIKDYSKSGAPWTPTKAGKYLYGVHIKDRLSTKRLDTHLYKEITITHDDFQDYTNLLSMFPKENQGNSLEPTLKPPGPSAQPMTYGLVLSSEALHYKSNLNIESAERIRNAVKWIVENADANQDGNPGWGLPQAWDAFSDGTTNPENHPYTITTSIVLQGLLDAISIEGLWSDVEEKEIKELISEVSIYWLENVYVGDDEMGYLGYSEEPTDMTNSPNVSGMFLNNLVRALKIDDIFDQEEREFVTKRVHALTNKLVDTVILTDGQPYWKYNETNNSDVIVLNDLVHHIYIIWGIEEYRESFDDIIIPFTHEDSISSIDSFWKNNEIHSYPQNRIYTGDLSHFNSRPANLWGTGMMLAFYSKYGQTVEADKCLEAINVNYGPIPNLTMWPLEFSNNKDFYARYSAHVLLGLSYKNFYE